MTSDGDASQPEFHDPAYGALADGRRRRVLEALLEREGALTVMDLATHLAVTELDTSVDAVDDEVERSFRIDLVTVQLPALEEAGFVHWNRESGTVSTTSHPALDDPKLKRIVESDVENLDGILDALASERRRTALSILDDRDRSMSRADLAAVIVAQETDRGDAPDTETVRLAAASLHHVHLPKLEAAGLVEYDSSDATVSYEADSALPDEFYALPGPGCTWEAVTRENAQDPARRENDTALALIDSADE